MLAAATIGMHFGVTPAQINEALTEYVPSNNRSQLTVTENNKLVVDTYNANPTSMMAALENFTLMAMPSKMAILGSMGELGAVSHDEHQRIVNYLTQHGYNDVWLVGKEFCKIECNYRKFADVEAVKQELLSHPLKDQCILIKGSNTMRLFELPPLL